MLFSEGDQVGAAFEFPLSPGRNHLDVWVQGISSELKPHLVIALAGGAMGDGIGPGFFGNLDEALGDQRPRD